MSNFFLTEEVSGGNIYKESSTVLLGGNRIVSTSFS